MRAEKAVPYWHQAGQRAIQRSAHAEVIAHLRQGLALLQTLPETPERLQREVDIHIALGASLIATQGYAAPEVGQTYTRAQQLCQYLEDPRQLFPVLPGLWNYYNVRADFRTAHTLGEQLLTLAQQAQDATMLAAAHAALGRTSGLDHGVGHFRPLSITRQRHLSAYHGTARSQASLCQVF
jgi:hypothetical protein